PSNLAVERTTIRARQCCPPATSLSRPSVAGSRPSLLSTGHDEIARSWVALDRVDHGTGAWFEDVADLIQGFSFAVGPRGFEDHLTVALGVRAGRGDGFRQG